jgi:hypothetical protein
MPSKIEKVFCVNMLNRSFGEFADFFFFFGASVAAFSLFSSAVLMISLHRYGVAD